MFVRSQGSENPTSSKREATGLSRWLQANHRLTYLDVKPGRFRMQLDSKRLALSRIKNTYLYVNPSDDDVEHSEPEKQILDLLLDRSKIRAIV
jgi:hypothetical protein